MNLERHKTLDWLLWVLPITVFMLCILYQINLPGLYMDAVNPDFLAAQKLDHHLHNPGAALPSKIFPILGNLYHGVQNFYVDLPVLALFGFNVAPLRIAQALFGAALLVAFYVAVRRLTRSDFLALASALGLATEIAFTASFRTQFYIVMGGATWLFFSLMLALPREAQSAITKRSAFWSGFFSGLAGYGYFVLFFFAPGMLALMILRPRSGWHETLHWMLGFGVGLTPFVVGYLSLMLKLHGIAPTATFIQGLLTALHPFHSSGANDGNLLYAWHMTQLAITNAGNDSMIFGRALPSIWGQTKFYLLMTCSLVMSLWSLLCLLRRRENSLWALTGLLPLSYLLMASLFGRRLWAHHFCVLVPFIYLLSILLLAKILEALRVNTHLQRVAIALAFLGVIIGNIQQQRDFHQELSRSGGEGLSTEALTQLALEARSAAPNVAYIFPEWGFFTSFCLLTENKVRYVIDLDPATLADLRKSGYSDFRLAYWQPSQRNLYIAALQQGGAHKITERTFTTLDGRPVFYWIEGQ